MNTDKRIQKHLRDICVILDYFPMHPIGYDAEEKSFFLFTDDGERRAVSAQEFIFSEAFILSLQKYLEEKNTPKETIAYIHSELLNHLQDPTGYLLSLLSNNDTENEES